jgi:hypothetical protein
MNYIVLDENYRVKSDNLQYILQKKHLYKNKKTGDPYEMWKDVSYNRFFKDILNNYVRELELKPTPKSIKDLIQRMTNIQNTLDSVIKKTNLPSK